jgi:hypothetical protein
VRLPAGWRKTLPFVIGLKALLLLAAVFYGLAAYFALFAADRVKQNHEAAGLASTLGIGLGVLGPANQRAE